MTTTKTNITRRRARTLKETPVEAAASPDAPKPEPAAAEGAPTNEPAADRREEDQKFQFIHDGARIDTSRMRASSKAQLATLIANTPELLQGAPGAADATSADPIDVSETVAIAMTVVGQGAGYLLQLFGMITPAQRRAFVPRPQRVEEAAPRVLRVLERRFPASSLMRSYQPEAECADSLVGMFREMLEDAKTIDVAPVPAAAPTSFGPRAVPAPEPRAAIAPNVPGVAAEELPDGGGDLDMAAIAAGAGRE